MTAQEHEDLRAWCVRLRAENERLTRELTDARARLRAVFGQARQHCGCGRGECARWGCALCRQPWNAHATDCALSPAREPSGCEACGGTRVVQKLSGMAPCGACGYG